MAKPKIPNHRNANIEHKKRTERYALLIQQIFDRVAQDAARRAAIVGVDVTKPFSFADYTSTREAMAKLQAQLMAEMTGIIMSGTSAEWKESNLVQDLVAKKVLTAYTGTSKHGEEYSRYFQTNPDALKAFQERKDEGMNLSSRVWKLSEQYKAELEESITAAIAPGMPAMELAAEVKKYLKEPDKRFRRIKEKQEDGTIKYHLSKNAKAYHPGQGIYRSSARNAQRLARTEINMAYRTAEQTRWQQFDFVVGYEVKTTQNGMHVEDICDQLAGKYPKDFVFKGWHPQCMCFTIPILKTEKEFWADDSENSTESVNEVTDVPQGFKDWIADNQERIEKAEERGKLTYFIKDNKETVDDVLNPKEKLKAEPEITPHYGAAMKLGRSATKEAMKIVENIGAPELTEMQKTNVRELAKVLGIPQKEVKPMSFLVADEGKSNPLHDDANCQSCIVSYFARRQGLNCYALPYSTDTSSASFHLGERFQDAWINPKTNKIVEPVKLKGNSDEEILKKLRNQLTSDGEYVLGINQKDGNGHVLNIIKRGDSVIIHDEQPSRQSERFINIESITDIDSLELLRVDKYILNIQLVKQVLGIL